jgi:flagellar capping protein FliD
MSDTQLLPIALAALPTMLTVLVGILINNSRLGDMNSRLSDMNSRLNDMGTRIDDLRAHMDSRFADVDRRFDEMRDLWRAELHRVEEVLDARLKHIEERG